jgi:hypothetical protein
MKTEKPKTRKMTFRELSAKKLARAGVPFRDEGDTIVINGISFRFVNADDIIETNDFLDELDA